MPADDLAPLVDGAARKVRMAQIGFADDPREQRETYLVELIGQLASGVPPDRRSEFLAGLMDEFPVWDAAPLRAEQPPSAPDTADTLLARLIEHAGTMTARQREEAATRLREAGLFPAPVSDSNADACRSSGAMSKHVEDACSYVMRELGISSLDLVRTLKMVVLFARHIGSSDAVIWKLWKLIAPRSTVKRSCDLREEIARYASGDKGVSGRVLKADLDQLQNMAMWLLAAIGQAGAEVANSHLAKFAPMAIQTEANKEGGFGLEVRCWKRYASMAHGLEADEMDFAFREAIVRRVEQFMKQKQP